MKRGRVPREPSSVSPSRRCDFQSRVRGQRTPEERGVLLRRRICDCCLSSRPTFRTGHGTRSLLIWRERESAAARPRAQCLARRPRPATAGRGAGFGGSVRTSRSRVHELRFPHTFTNMTPTLATVAPARVLTETPHATGQAAGPAQKGPPSRLCPALRGRSADSRGGRHTCNPVTVLTQQEGGLEIQAGAAGLAKPAPSTGYRRRRAPHFMAPTPSPALTSPAHSPRTPLSRPWVLRGGWGTRSPRPLREQTG